MAHTTTTLTEPLVGVDPNIVQEKEQPTMLEHTPQLDGTNNPPKPEPEAKSPQKLQFFNYHEYLEEGAGTQAVVNHFPNPYVDKQSPEFTSTRIVRIPRAYHLNEKSDMIPQFLTAAPGAELAAILDGQRRFEPTVTIQQLGHPQVFGTTLWTPLIPEHISEQKLLEVVTTINSYLAKAYSPYAAETVIENAIDIATGGWYSLLSGTSHTKRQLEALEKYVEATNGELRAIKIISPRRSGFLSLDIQIPTPTK